MVETFAYEYNVDLWLVFPIYFQAVTVLERHVKFHKIEMSQLQVLLTFCEEDLRVNISYIFLIFTGCDCSSKTCEVSQDRDVSTPSFVNFL